MTTYTNSQLLAVWAKLLPDKVFLSQELNDPIDIYPRYRNVLIWVKGPEVRPTEMLALCEMAEESLSYSKKCEYQHQFGDYHAWNSCFNAIHASWQQKTQALCAVEGIIIQ